MSRFDDDLREAAGLLVDEPMPAGVLDDALDTPEQPTRSSLAGLAGITIVLVGLATGVGWAIGRQSSGVPTPTASTRSSLAPTGQAVRHQIESDGIRLTVELDSDLITEGVPVLATTIVENLGTTVVYHSVSGGCEWAVGMFVEPIVPFEPGRAWGGSAGDLKGILLQEWEVDDFTPYYFVGADRLPDLSTGCFMNAGRKEIPAGSSQTDRLAWRPLGPFGMPMPSGTYEMTAVFGRLTGDEFHNRDRSNDVSLTFQIDVEGSDADLLMPGEAIDVVLADDRFQEFLAEVRPERWIVPRLEYAGERWLVWIPVGKPDAWIDVQYEVTAEVDARTGALLAISTGGEGTASDPPPDQPLRHQIEDQGIRLTVELERDRILTGGTMLAEITLENVGEDTVFWGHSSTCTFPVSMEIRPESAERFAYGQDWDGEAGILKGITVDERWSTSGPTFFGIPPDWLGGQRHGCTSDLVTSEFEPGTTLEQLLAWDPATPHGMPPPPGAYGVSVKFGYMSRGAPPGFNAEVELDQFSVGFDFTVDVLGPDLAYLSPGQAMDRLLANEEYQALLADSPRERWGQSEIHFVDGVWIASLELSASGASIDPIEAIVGEVDALTGDVTHVRLDPRP